MAIDNVTHKLFDKFGVSFTLIKGADTINFHCILDPLRYKNKIYLSGVPTELGYDSLRKYLILAPPEIPLDSVDGIANYLVYSGYRYKVDHCEQVYFKGQPLYYWSIIHKEDTV